jgi:hypothetical protein
MSLEPHAVISVEVSIKEKALPSLNQRVIMIADFVRG